MFEKILGKEKAEEKQLERDRYLQGQLNLLQSKLNRLEEIMSVGMPLSEAEETIEKLQKMEKEIKIASSKHKMFSVVLGQLKKDLEMTRKVVDEKVSLNQVSLLSTRINTLEKVYEEFSSGKTKDVFMNIVEIIQNLETRTRDLEAIARRNINLLFEKEIDEVKKESAGITGRTEEVKEETEAPEYVETEGPQEEKPQKKLGFFDRIEQFIDKLFGKPE